MKRVTLALATLLLALAVIPAADARVVQPPWLLVRWDLYGDCKIWRNDINALGVPAGGRWHTPIPIRRPTESCRRSLSAGGAASRLASISRMVSPGSAGRNFFEPQRSRGVGDQSDEAMDAP